LALSLAGSPYCECRQNGFKRKDKDKGGSESSVVSWQSMVKSAGGRGLAEI
jgi:hypothetical protein